VRRLAVDGLRGIRCEHADRRALCVVPGAVVRDGGIPSTATRLPLPPRRRCLLGFHLDDVRHGTGAYVGVRTRRGTAARRVAPVHGRRDTVASFSVSAAADASAWCQSQPRP
jgi:hypothetical protein